VVSFIGGGNQSTWRKPPICRKSLTKSHNVVHFAMNGVLTQLKVVLNTIIITPNLKAQGYILAIMLRTFGILVAKDF
jgi:hypothetical protein